MSHEQQELPGISEGLTFKHPIFNDEPTPKPRSGPMQGQMVLPPAGYEDKADSAYINEYGNATRTVNKSGMVQGTSFVDNREYNMFGPQFDAQNSLKQVWDNHAVSTRLHPDTVLDTLQNGLRNPPRTRDGEFPPGADGKSLADLTEADFQANPDLQPSVIKSNGRLVPVDGHHRLERQRQLGMDPLVKLLDIDHPMTRAHVAMSRYGAYDQTGKSYGPPYI